MLKKTFSIGIVSLFVIGGLVGIFVAVPVVVDAPGPTYVSGLILVNTTWILADSPYIVIGNVSVDQDVTLTIEPGVIVKFSIDKYLRVDGTLNAIGTESQIITFTSNKTSPNPGDWGGLRFENTSLGSIIKYCIIEYSGGKYVDPSTKGGGIYNIANELEISNSKIINNSADLGGGISNSGAMSIYNSEILNNSANYAGGGIINWDGGLITINNSKIHNNSLITGHGGGIANWGTIIINNSLIFNNFAFEAGGISNAIGSIIMNNCKINNNSANQDGGGIFNNDFMVLKESEIFENSGNYGGGIFNDNILLIENSSIFANSANYGAGIYNRDGTTNITYSVITQNLGYGIHGDDSISYCSIINNSDGGIKGNPIKLTYTNLNNPNYNIFLLSSSNVNAPYNWWGTINTDLINQSIHDFYDDFSLGKVLYLPFLTESYQGGSGLQPGAPWPMFRGNVRHTGLSPYNTSGNPGELKWSFETGGMVISSPSIDKDGTIYFGSDDGHFYAIYSNGTKKWDINIEWYVESSPAIDINGIIYFGSHNRRFYAIYPNGSEKWVFKTDEIVYSSPTIGSDGTIYMGSYDHKLYAIYPNGTERWNFTTNGGILSSPALGTDGTIYVASGDASLYAIFPNGTERWNFELGSSLTSSPAIGSDGTIYIGSGDERIYAVNPNGTEKWRFITEGSIRSSPAIGSDGTIYIGSNDRKLYAIYPNGSEKWNFNTGDWVASSPAIGSDGTIYFRSNDGNLYALNPDDIEKWNLTAVGGGESSPAIGSDGTIYIGSNHRLIAIGESINQPPNTPSTPSGPTSGITNISYSFSTSTTDPDGDQIKYGWDWDGDGIVDEWSNLVDSGIEDNRSHSWTFTNIYDVKVKVQDENGNESGWSNVLTVTITSPPNQSPIIPTLPSGPSSGLTNTSYSFSTSTTDPDGDQIKYGWDWDGDGTVDEWSNLLDSGTEDNRSHSWTLPDIYNVKVKAQDENSAESDWSDALIITISSPPNQQPNNPPLPSGPPSGYTNTSYSFSITTTDPDGDQIKYGWDWDGDGTVDEWSDLMDSGNEDNRSHSWSGPGIYSIKVKVQDEYGEESGWSNAQSITIISPDPGPPLADSHWPKFRGNMKNTGLSPYDTSGNKGESKWKFETDFKIKGSPAIGPDGTIYFGSYDSKFYAINQDGSEKWHFTTGDGIGSTPAISSDGTIYFGSYDNKFYALNPDGSEKWNYITGDDIYGSPAIGVDGTIYIGSSDTNFYAFYPDGTVKWVFTTPQGYVNSCPAFDSNGTIYIGSLDDYFYAINPDGTEKWNFTAGNQGIGNSAAIGSDGTLYFGTYDNKLVALNPDGSEKWIYTFGTMVQSSPAIGPDGTIYVGCNDKKMYAINPDGAKKWSYLTSSYITQSPAIGSEGTIYFASTNVLYAANPDGSIKWTYGAISPISSPAIDSNGTIYIGSEDTFLYAIGPRIPNQPPNTPTLPSGSNSGSTNTLFSFSTSTTDPEGNQIKYGWDWNGDGTVDEWSDFVDSGTEDNRSHSWTVAGIYNIKVKVQDEISAESDWSDALIVTITDEIIDSDNDGIPDSEDEDDDNDGYNDDIDTFPLNPDEWLDSDFDGTGNNADLDDDNDGYNDFEDYYPLDPTKWLPESDISLSSITLSKYGPSAGEEVTIYVEIQNVGDNDCDALVKVYDGDPNNGGTQIGIDHAVTIPADGTATISVTWTATAGDHTIYAVVEDLGTSEKVLDYLPVTVGENIPSILVLSTGDINIYRFEPGQERTVSVEVTCYLQTVENVHLVVLDDQNVTIDHTITPSRTMTDGETTKFYLRIKAPQLPEGVDKLERDIVIQAVGDNGIFSNAEELDIVVSESAISLFNPILIAGAVATASLATLGAAAAASRRNENWKYLLLLTFAVPLYTRIHGKKTLDNFVRGQVFGHIQSKPGTHFNEIKKTLKVGNGNLVYHLRKLEKEGFIFSKRDRRFRRFYPVGVEVPEGNGIKLSKNQENILDFIERHPEATQKEIAKQLKESQQTTSYNINVLVREGFLKEEKIKGTKRYEILDENT